MEPAGVRGILLVPHPGGGVAAVEKWILSGVGPEPAEVGGMEPDRCGIRPRGVQPAVLEVINVVVGPRAVDAQPVEGFPPTAKVCRAGKDAGADGGRGICSPQHEGVGLARSHLLDISQAGGDAPLAIVITSPAKQGSILHDSEGVEEAGRDADHL